MRVDSDSMSRHIILRVKVPAKAFITIKKDGSVGYRVGQKGRRIVVGKIKRRDGYIYFANGQGHVFEQVSTFGKKKAKRPAKKGAAKGRTKKTAKKSAKRPAKKVAKKSAKRPAKKSARKPKCGHCQ